MDALILGLYAFCVWLVFFKLKWLLWNTKKPLKRFAGPVYRLVRHRMMAARA